MIEPKKILFSSEYIKLDSFLKLSAACDTGGEAKMVVQNGEVLVNGEICLQRGRKLHSGDTVEINNTAYFACKKE